MHVSTAYDQYTRVIYYDPFDISGLVCTVVGAYRCPWKAKSCIPQASKAKQHTTTPRTEKDKKEKEETKGRTVTDLYTSAFQLLNA